MKIVTENDLSSTVNGTTVNNKQNQSWLKGIIENDIKFIPSSLSSLFLEILAKYLHYKNCYNYDYRVIDNSWEIRHGAIELLNTFIHNTQFDDTVL